MESFYEQLAVDISNKFDLEVIEHENLVEKNFEQLRNLLVVRIRHLILNDYSGLLNMLYRIDVSEKISANCLSIGTIDDAATCLANAVIDRQLIKFESWRKWKDEHPE